MLQNIFRLILLFGLALIVGCSTSNDEQNGNVNSMSDNDKATITNPLWEADFPDPHVLRSSNGWYSYATGNPGYYNIGVSFSSDFNSWSPVTEALPDRPSWQPITQGLTWAPDISHVGDRYLMLYVARHESSGLQCLSRAWADAPEGPFVDNSKSPFICQSAIGGTIDPHIFVDSNGKKYMYFKNDGNAVGVETKIWVAAVDEDGDLLQEPVDTGLRNFRSWHGAVVEAPSVFVHQGRYYLTYSANDYGSEYYAIGWAVSDSPLGPWQDKSIEPLLSTIGVVAGPGGQQIFLDDDSNLWIAYHAWTYGKVGYGGAGNARSFRVDPVEIVNGELTTKGPSVSPIAKPATR